MSLVSIVVPVYHNAASLADLLHELQAVAARNPEDSFEFICVDDGSRDDSFAVLQALGRDEPRLRIVRLSRNFGSVAAVMAGLSLARGDCVADISADLQDPPALLHDMLAQWRAGSKLVLAARRGRDDPFPTSLLSDAFYALFRRFAIASMPRRGFDFWLIDRQLADLINSIQESNAYLSGLLLWLGFEPTVLYFDRQARPKKYGQSMWTLRKKIKYFIDSFVAFSHFPVQLATTLGMLFSLLGLAYAAFIVYRQLALGIDVAGWSSLMVVALLAAGVQLLILGVLGEYLWRNLDETRRRPRFIIDQVIESADNAQTPSPPMSQGEGSSGWRQTQERTT
ncbi:MAG: glycosyltransferase [Chloroflexi bacterium]|nr:glycosyltransferase [Chloroflexota bacterium]